MSNDGVVAEVIHDVLFAGTVVYNDLVGSAVTSKGVWTMTTVECCGFMSSADIRCP